MSNLIDVTFFIEDEATVSRALVEFENISHVSSRTITNFSGSSAGTYPSLVLKRPIRPFADFELNELVIQHDEYEKIKNKYFEIAKTIIGGEF